MYFLAFMLFVSLFDDGVLAANSSIIIRRSFSCECGTQPDYLLNTRIVGGEEVEPHAFPWAVAFVKIPSKSLHCGGALITNKHVLSAGHCFKWDNYREMEIYLGLHSLDDLSGTQRRRITNAVIHEGFTSNEVRDTNDIAIAYMDQTVEMSDIIKPVCLPGKMQEFSKKIASVIGWGRLGFNKRQAKALREATVTVLSDSDCRQTKIPAQYLENSMMCAYADGKDGCQGDSGGPLLTYDNRRGGRFISVGIVSWGLGCATPDHPGIYTKVSYYINWIYEKTRDGTYCS